MMKNMEWGAVAYLTNSQYGRCTNNTCEEVRMNNNSNCITGSSAINSPICGYTETNEECNRYGPSEEIVNRYYNSNSQKSSTTGNYFGVYDMSGGAWEFVMGVMQAGINDARPATGPNASTNSGFKGPYLNESREKSDGLEWPSSKYYDLYEYSISQQEYQRGNLGDATKELGPFYNVSYQKMNGTGPVRGTGSYNSDLAHFVNSRASFFIRGGAFPNGSEDGVFAFNSTNGSLNTRIGFRVILTP